MIDELFVVVRGKTTKRGKRKEREISRTKRTERESRRNLNQVADVRLKWHICDNAATDSRVGIQTRIINKQN